MNLVIEEVTVMAGVLNIIVPIRKTILWGGGCSDYITKNILHSYFSSIFSNSDTVV